MARFEIVVLTPESTRKLRGGTPEAGTDAIGEALPPDARGKLEALREQVRTQSPSGSIATQGLLPAYERYDGNMYHSIPRDAWEGRAPNVEVVIASALRSLVASRDLIPGYKLSMAEKTPPFGKLNRWWHDHGLPLILAAYLRAVRPKVVVDLLSLEYRESVQGFAAGVNGIEVKTIDFPGMGRGSQPLRGERIAEILRTGKV